MDERCPKRAKKNMKLKKKYINLLTGEGQKCGPQERKR